MLTNENEGIVQVSEMERPLREVRSLYHRHVWSLTERGIKTRSTLNPVDKQTSFSKAMQYHEGREQTGGEDDRPELAP
jgi:hypothetical protein